MAPAEIEITISLRQQVLNLWRDGKCVKQYWISTGANGIGQVQGSGCTPRGRHIIRAKIGAGMPSGTVFKARRVAQDVPVYSEQAAEAYPNRDWILSRILWLSGTELGYNRLGCVDTFRRYIYIHGTPDTHKLGEAASHGCIRMACKDVIELFEIVSIGTFVTLHE